MAPTTTPRSGKGIDFGLIFFSSSEAPFNGDRYHLVIESTKFADQHGFSSIWIPERHFTKDGWLYPNPAVLQAALARETSQIGLRAGSVVIPLHNPLRVAEEWAMVDNLSGGRVGVSFASGWHPNDFALFPENYQQRSEIMYQGIETVRKLWRGEAVQVKGGDGKLIELKTYPPPIQREIPIWITAAGNPKTFAGAGAIGANLLTHMYNQSVDELAEKIRIYRESLAQHGYDPAAFQVSVMLHTFVGADMATVRAQLQGPFSEYLKSASYLVNAIAYSRGQQVDLTTLSEQDLQDYLLFVFDRLVSQQRVLFGTPESCSPLIAQLKAAGVNEIACQLDFGVDSELVLQSMPYLHQLKELSNATSATDAYAPVLPVHVQATSMQHIAGINVQSQDATHVASANGQSNGAKHLISANEQLNGAHYVASTSAMGHTASVVTARQDNRLSAIHQRCRDELHLPTFYQQLGEHGLQLGETFQGIKRLWRGEEEALGQIQLSPNLAQEAAAYQVHPTLLDACFQVMIATLPDSFADGALYLPSGMRSFQLHQKPGQQLWSHARLQGKFQPLATTIEGDVRILDEQGQLIAEATGIQLLRAEPVTAPAPTTASTELADWLYELHWEATTLTPPANKLTAQSTHWLIFMDRQGVGQQLAQQLTERGDTYTSVSTGAGYQAISTERYLVNPAHPAEVQQIIQNEMRAGRLQGIVHLWSLDATPTALTSPASLEADQELGVHSALDVIQALLEYAGTAPARLWLVTRGAQAVAAANTTPLSLSQSPLWGLGKTCAMEHTELWGGLIDLDPLSSIQLAGKQLLSTLSADIAEDQLAFRQDQAFVARMVRSKAMTQQPLKLRADGSYLITGGLWGLGLEVAHWLVQQGARHLVLLGRSKLPARVSWSQLPVESRAAQQVAGIRSLEQLGADVHYASVDVANEAELAAFLQTYSAQGHPPLCGVMHAASVWQDAQGHSLVRPLAHLKRADLQTVFRPKMVGGWLLHTLLQEYPLDFFVSFSSGASLFGSAAQGNYAAAGEFLDILAQHQRMQGQSAISIDWGAVSTLGFGATADGLRVHEYWEAHGIQRITPAQVLAALALLIPQKLARVGVIKLDWQLLRQFYPQISTLPLVRYLLPDTLNADVQASTSRAAENATLQTLLAASASERATCLLAYLSEQVASVLHVSVQRLDIEQPLTTLGLDSLMAIELKNRIERAIQVRIPLVTFLQGPSIAQFSNQVLDQLNALVAADTVLAASVPVTRQDIQLQYATENNPGQADAAQLLAQLDQLSDQEVDALLKQMLAEEASNGHNGNGHHVSNGNDAALTAQEAARLLTQLDQLPDDEVDSLLNDMVQKEEKHR